MTAAAPKLSVVIANYNYADYVGEAIKSVLSQDVDLELVVVDDGSTDNSREVISRYEDVAKLVLFEKNQGQGAGFNAGFAATTGDLIMFLDSDDFMMPGAARNILANYDGETALYLYRMHYADIESATYGMFPPPQVPFGEGDLSPILRDIGSYPTTVTSGMVCDRKALEQAFPMNPQDFGYGADGFLANVVPLYGKVRGMDEIISAYRQHASQHSKFRQVYGKRARWRIDHHNMCFNAIREHAARQGLDVAPDIGMRDPQHLQERLISVMIEPEQHPDSSDTKASLLQALRKANIDRYGGKKALAKNAWWITIGFAPGALGRTLLVWKIDEHARPKWLNATGRWMRQRLGIVTN